MEKKIVLVTGATAGFGKAIAIKFAQNGWDVILNGRRADRLDELEKEISELGVKALKLKADVRDVNEVTNAFESIPSEWKNIDVLVNNAGLAVGKGSIHEGEIDDWNRMIDTNVKGLLYVTRQVTPWMIERKKGHIINIGSIAGKEVYAGGNVYCASKHAVDAISKSLRIELLEHEIKVTQIAPGAAETEFSIVRYKGDEEKAKNVYTGYSPLLAEDIAETSYFAATRPKHVCLNDIVITATAQASAHYLHKQS